MTAIAATEASTSLLPPHLLEVDSGKPSPIRLGSGDRSDGLARYSARLDARIGRPTRIALLGEFNTGKTSLANALIGREVLPTSVLANTRVPVLIHYSPEVSLAYEATDRVRRPVSMSGIRDIVSGTARMLHVGLPVARLKSFELIDTPGLASGATGVDDLLMEACRRSHLAIWCTMATQAWKASEQEVWARLPHRLRARSLLCVTHKDAITSERDRMRLMQRLDAEAQASFRSVVMVSAFDANSAALAIDTDSIENDPAKRERSDLDGTLKHVIETELIARASAAERALHRIARRFEEQLVETMPKAVG